RVARVKWGSWTPKPSSASSATRPGSFWSSSVMNSCSILGMAGRLLTGTDKPRWVSDKSAFFVRARRAGGPGGLFLVFLVEDLVEDVVLPLAGDLEVLRGDAVGGEAVLLQHALRGGVVQQRLRLQAVQAQLGEGDLLGLGDGAGGQAAAVAVGGDPVAEGGGLQGAAGDAVDVEAACDAALGVQDHQRDPGA